MCDCDYSEDMAIPRHRIQYFSYKGQRVWDRDSRTDHVFGSTGQSVMPPFDKGDQLQGELFNHIYIYIYMKITFIVLFNHAVVS